MRNQPSKSKPTFEEGQHVYHEGYGHGYRWGWRRKPGLSIAFDNYAKGYLLSVWNSTTEQMVWLLKEQVEDAGGTFKVAV